MVHSASPHTQPGAAKSVADILDAAADLIEPEGRWTQGDYARTETRKGTYWDDPQAACWCTIGAIYRVCGDKPAEAVREEVFDTLAEVTGARMPGWNDAPERTQAEVVAALRAAAEKARTDAETDSVGTKAERPE